MQIKHAATKGSNVPDIVKAFLHDEYMQVKAHMVEGTIGELCVHYELGTDWFKKNATRLRNEKTAASKKLGSNGGKRKWTPAVAEQARDLNKKYNRRASNKTIAAGLGLDKSLALSDSFQTQMLMLMMKICIHHVPVKAIYSMHYGHCGRNET
jgi:hypothetical protein